MISPSTADGDASMSYGSNELDHNVQTIVNLLGGANGIVQIPMLENGTNTVAAPSPVSSVEDIDMDDNHSVTEIIERDKQTARRTFDLSTLVMNYGSTLGDPYFASPIPMTTRSKYLVNYLFASRCHSVRTLLGFCWRWFHTDVGVFYHMLAASASCLTHKSGHNRDALKQEALAYFNESIASVNHRIGDQSTSGPSNGMISAVVAIALTRISTSAPHMSCWSSALWTKEREGMDSEIEWQTHLSGLKAMVDARGGVKALDDDKPLRYAIFALDTWGATASNSRPKFLIPRDLVGDASTLPRPAPESLLAAQLETWQRAFPSRTEVCTVLSDLDAVLKFTNDAAKQGGQPWSGAWMGSPDALNEKGFPHWDLLVREWLIPIITEAQLLLPVDRRDQSQAVDHQMQEALRHSIVLTISAATRRFGLGMKGIEVRVTDVKTLLFPTLPIWKALGLEIMLLWILLTAGIESANYADEQRWFAEQIAARLEKTDGSYAAVEAAILRPVRGFISLEHILAAEGFILLVDMVQALVTKRALPPPLRAPVHMPAPCHH